MNDRCISLVWTIKELRLTYCFSTFGSYIVLQAMLTAIQHMGHDKTSSENSARYSFGVYTTMVPRPRSIT